MEYGELQGRAVLITGVSRPGGIGAALAASCADAGAVVAVHGLQRYDEERRYPDANQRVDVDARLRVMTDSDLGDAGAPELLVNQAREALGRSLDGLVVNHAHSTMQPLGTWTAAEVDRHLHVNVTSAMLLLQAFVRQLHTDKPASVVALTSGQYLGPMIGEIGYAASKEALRTAFVQASYALAPRNIRVNLCNPGPTDTGYLQGAAREGVRQRFPFGRWGTPHDVAHSVVFLLGSRSAWITGQTLASEGGFQR